MRIFKNNRRFNDSTKQHSLRGFVFILDVHDYVINENYEPPSIYALLKAKNWVHHTPLISDEGVTNAWTEIGTLEKREGKVIGRRVFINHEYYIKN